MTADEATTKAQHVGWVEFVTADDAALTHIAYVYEDGSLYLPEGPDVVSADDFRLAAATDRIWPLVRRAAERARAALDAEGYTGLDDEVIDIVLAAQAAAAPVTPPVTAEQVAALSVLEAASRFSHQRRPGWKRVDVGRNALDTVLAMHGIEVTR